MFNELLDQRNIGLWNKLISQFDIQIIETINYKLEFKSDSNSALIYVDTRKSKELFTHELLHLELRYFGLDTVTFFDFTKFNQYEEQIAYNLLNNIEHILFFDEFIKLKFNPKLFVEGISNKKVLDKQINQYKMLEKIDLKLYYTSLYFTLKAEEYYGEKRFDFLMKLKKLNKKYFEQCEKAYSSILDLDLEIHPNVQFEKIMKILFTE